ncbi:MAG: hypothetical protein EZS28_023994 [Streblomastix strix]|uniref:RNase H type-1 domain-containing protein n=1 Tax=Streblomastix strix TaxID=222440 RepID=A0A5J4VD55_9EUKA|nr:MAG: hypothetical protein EZS28_023994 [Streblomastix strix]
MERSVAFQQQAGNDGMGQMENNNFNKFQLMRTVEGIKIRTDNQVSMYCINKCQAAKPLSATLDSILLLAEMNKWTLKAEYIPGIQNRVPDSLSRIARSGDQQLRRDVLQKNLDQLEIKISLDAFATRLNRQHRMFCSYKRNNWAMAIDGLSIRWINEIPLLFPPLPLMLRTIRKI